jgi:glycosyltransferase involved in cell wall biosynthesis
MFITTAWGSELAPHCLLVTHLPLTNLLQKRYGIYRRLTMLAEAAIGAGVGLRIFCLQPPTEDAVDTEQLARDIAAEVSALWGVDCEIIVGHHRGPSRLPWLFQQLLGTMNYRWDWFRRQLLDENSRTRLAQAIVAKPAFIVAHRLPMASLLLPLTPAGVPVFFDLDDIEHLAVLRGIPQLNSFRNQLFAALSLPSLLWAETKAIGRARRTFVCSNIDAERTARQFRTDRLFILRNAVDMPAIPATAPAKPAAPILLMLGVYSYGPNLDAADYFVDEVFPLIQAHNPAAEIWFVGGAPESLKSYKTENPGVRFLGFVDDLGAVYNQARVVICPIRQGSGTRVKLIEAAAWAKPIVTTTIGAEGLDMVDHVHALFGDETASFAAQCVKLLDDDDLCTQLGRNARALAEQSYDKRKIVQKLAIELSKHTD